MLLVFVLTWTCDTAAYVVGRAIGRHRPWPALSPKKTVEGAVGGMLFTLLAAIVGRSWLAPELTLGAAIVLGLVVGVLCPIGDLVESLFKRQAGVKDSSTLIPGHGGLLDRVDSMLFSAPATYYVLALTAWLH